MKPIVFITIKNSLRENDIFYMNKIKDYDNSNKTLTLSNSSTYFLKLYHPYGLFTLPHWDTDSNSNSNCKPNGYILLRRTFHTGQSQIQIPILTANNSYGIGIGTRIGTGSVNINKPPQVQAIQ